MFQYDNAKQRQLIFIPTCWCIREYHRLFEFMVNHATVCVFFLSLSHTSISLCFMVLQLFLRWMWFSKRQPSTGWLRLNWLVCLLALSFPDLQLNCMANCWQPPDDLLELALNRISCQMKIQIVHMNKLFFLSFWLCFYCFFLLLLLLLAIHWY